MGQPPSQWSFVSWLSSPCQDELPSLAPREQRWPVSAAWARRLQEPSRRGRPALRRGHWVI